MREIMVSVIIPVLNGMMFLNDCFDSIQRQTLKSLEIIFVDDGSEDGSMELLQSFSRTDKRVRVLTRQHGGAGPARNLALKEAHGKYVSFLDADDMYCQENALETMVSVCEKENVKACGSYLAILDHGTLTEHDLFRDLRMRNGCGAESSFEEYQNDYYYQAFIFNREMLIRNSIFFPPYLRYQDAPFLVKALITADRFWVMPVTLYCYRWGHQSSAVIGKNIEHILCGIRDNLSVAVEKHYPVLYERLIGRLNNEYGEAIIQYSTPSVVERMEEIEELNSRREPRIEIRVIPGLRLRALWGNRLAASTMKNTLNRAFDIYRLISLLQGYGVSIEEAFWDVGLKNVYIYGAGEMGRIISGAIGGCVKVQGIFDAFVTDGQKDLVIHGKNNRSIKVLPAHMLPVDDAVIIVTPAASFQEISYRLMKDGHRRENIYSLYSILRLCVRHYMGKSSKDSGYSNITLSRQFLITGAQFENKGAQTMLFIAMHEIRKRWPGAVIWYLPVDRADLYTRQLQAKYNLLFLLDGDGLKSELFDVVPNLTAIVDVSGYALSSYWESEWYMNTLRIAYNYGIPLYLMPQSFGPFDFTESKDRELRKLLPAAKVIYVREKEGLLKLKSRYGLDNVRLSKDLVLQNKELDADNIYSSDVRGGIADLLPEASVGLIPNDRNYEFGERHRIIEMYRRLILYLREQGKNVYIFPFSYDFKCCQDIYENLQEHSGVYLIDKTYDCLEYGQLLKQFQFVVSSRYHAIVLAYKVGTPAISIGWADKYYELLNLFGQEMYSFDIRSGIDVDGLLSAVKRMDDNYKKEQEKIRNMLSGMQAENCFDVLDDLRK